MKHICMMGVTHQYKGAWIAQANRFIDPTGFRKEFFLYPDALKIVEHNIDSTKKEQFIGCLGAGLMTQSHIGRGIK